MKFLWDSYEVFKKCLWNIYNIFMKYLWNWIGIDSDIDIGKIDNNDGVTNLLSDFDIDNKI